MKKAAAIILLILSAGLLIRLFECVRDFPLSILEALGISELFAQAVLLFLIALTVTLIFLALRWLLGGDRE